MILPLLRKIVILISILILTVIFFLTIDDKDVYAAVNDVTRISQGISNNSPSLLHVNTRSIQHKLTDLSILVSSIDIESVSDIGSHRDLVA